MKTQIFSLMVVLTLLSGCASAGLGMSESESDWIDARHEYKRQCHDWHVSIEPKLERTTEEEKMMSEQDFLNYKCKTAPAICNPPSKSKTLVYYETMWRKTPTPEGCVFNQNDY